MVDGWNTYFDADPTDLPGGAAAAAGARNTDSVGQLFLGFLHYYAFEWDYDGAVVSVRAGRPLAKTTKAWDDASVARLLEAQAAQAVADKEAHEARAAANKAREAAEAAAEAAA
eukprot:contig_25424_g6271